MFTILDACRNIKAKPKCPTGSVLKSHDPVTLGLGGLEELKIWDICISFKTFQPDEFFVTAKFQTCVVTSVFQDELFCVIKVFSYELIKF